MRVLPKESTDSVMIGNLTDKYDVREVHETARRKGDGCLSPAGMFRVLAPGNRKHAIEFLETFGPLTRQEGDIVRVELNTFWKEQETFRVVAALYENRDTPPDELRKAIEAYLGLGDVGRPRSEAEMGAAADGFATFQQELKKKFVTYGARNLKELIYQEDLEKARSPLHEEPGLKEKEVPHYDPDYVLHRLDEGDDPRCLALYLVREEIQYHTDKAHFAWEQGHGREDDKFYRRVRYDSLLLAIWDLFAADTAGVSWRICPNDGNIFYPPRADRICCTSAEQVAWSKAQYEKAGRRKRRKKSRLRGGSKNADHLPAT
jgi:hypothetical protein